MITATYAPPAACRDCDELVCVCNLMIGTCNTCYKPVFPCDGDYCESIQRSGAFSWSVFRCNACMMGRMDA